YCYCCGADRHLHSFPTRRSSDLTDLGPHGADQVELLFSANPGSEPRGLGKVASGGELSRVRLAIEVILAAKSGNRGTFVFDEVRSEEHTSELQSRENLVCRLLLE